MEKNGRISEALFLLHQLDFGTYEARAYATLLQHNPLNGYELAKASGIPRPNVYAVLRKLERRGAAVRLDTPSGLRYSPLPPSELLQRMRCHFFNTLDAARQTLERLAQPSEQAYVWNAQGYSALQGHAQAVLNEVSDRLLIGIWPQEAQTLAAETAHAEERGVEIITLCWAGCPSECGHCRGSIYRYHLTPEPRARWLVLVSDDDEVLAGEIGPAEEASTIYARQQLLVELASWYIRHTIALAVVLSDLGSRFEELLKPETQALLAALGPSGERNSGWLLRHLRLPVSQAERTASESSKRSRFSGSREGRC